MKIQSEDKIYDLILTKYMKAVGFVITNWIFV